MRFAILGGTFDPIHYGHLIAAEQVADALNLEKVILIPAGSPPHKKEQPVTEAKYRYQMVSLAIAGNPHMDLSRMEIDREGPSYSIDTIRWYNRKYGIGETGFIIGVDALAEVLTWHEYEAVLREAHFLVLHRPGYDLSSLEQSPFKNWLNKIQFVQMPAIEISSTDIRERVRRKQSIRYLTPDSVIEYIETNRLYQPGNL